VLNAGVGTYEPLDAVTRRRLDRTLAVNLIGPLLMLLRCLPLLRAAARARPDRGARVIALSSITGVLPEFGLAAYGATKAALTSLVRNINLEEACSSGSPDPHAKR
jgi:3-oxoacyl-[acyl-carrier protein] reductase